MIDWLSISRVATTNTSLSAQHRAAEGCPIGLDRETAALAFSEFTSGTTATASQIEFIDLIVQYLTETGVMEPERLYESPFTDINPQGPEGVFPSAKVDQTVKVLAEIRQRAAA